MDPFFVIMLTLGPEIQKAEDAERAKNGLPPIERKPLSKLEEFLMILAASPAALIAAMVPLALFGCALVVVLSMSGKL